MKRKAARADIQSVPTDPPPGLLVGAAYMAARNQVLILAGACGQDSLSMRIQSALVGESAQLSSAGFMA